MPAALKARFDVPQAPAIDRADRSIFPQDHPETSKTPKITPGRPYEVLVKLDRHRPCTQTGVLTLFRKGMLCHVKSIQARNRAEAVKKAVNWYWLTYRGTEPAYQVLQIEDPYDEVTFTPDFRCHDPKNKYLPDEIVEKLIAESGGKLERDTKLYLPGKPPASVRWRKKWGKMEETVSNSRTCRRRRPPPLKWVAPCIYKDHLGRFWYSMLTQKQQIAEAYQRHREDRVYLSKRKKKLIRLEAGTLAQAIEEIQSKDLLRVNQSSQAERQFRKLLEVISHLQST